jgi:glucose-6-phosphate 1-epimerase
VSNRAALVRTALPAVVSFDESGGALPRLLVRSPAASADIYFQGAHLAAWHPAGAAWPVLWISRKSLFQPARPIRGGVPICFPWFGAHGVDPAAPIHGFARVLPWTLIGAGDEPEGAVSLEFELAGEGVSPLWPHAFAARYRVGIGAELTMELEVRNAGRAPFTFEEALHSYFGVGDVRRVSVAGLEGSEYLDKVEGLARRRQGEEPIRFTGETDRVYLDTRSTCVIHDSGASRDIVIDKTGSDATVVWNPWVAKARAMADFGDDEWTEMVCVETCNANIHAKTLAPGESHTMTARVEARDARAR